jgi:hypothetical protein
MGGHIRMSKDLREDPRIEDLAEALVEQLEAFLVKATPEQLKAFCGDAVLGGLYRLWCHGDAFLGRHNRLKGRHMLPPKIAKVTALPVSLLQCFPEEWLKFHPDGTVELPEYAEKNALIHRDSRRESGRKRTAKWRQKKRAQATDGDASHAVTDERHTRHQSVTTGTGTGTGTGTIPSETIPGTGDRNAPPPADPQRGAAARRELRTLVRSLADRKSMAKSDEADVPSEPGGKSR